MSVYSRDEDTGILTTHTQSCPPFLQALLSSCSPITWRGLGAGSSRFSSAYARLDSASMALAPLPHPPPPPPANKVCLCHPPPLRYFGPLASSLPASLPSSLPLEPSPPISLLSIALPQSIFPRPLPACSSSCLQSLAPQSSFISLSSTPPSLVFLIFLSPSNPFPKFLSQAPSISLSLSLFLSPPFSLPCSPHLCLPHLAPPIPLPCSLHSCPGLTPPVRES